ncbi:MAG: GlxA family transcriptional regulator [Pseudomonadota bacterium]
MSEYPLFFQKPEAKSFKIALLLLDGFNSMAMQAFVDPFRTANYLKAANLYEWDFLSLRDETVAASNGLMATNLTAISLSKTKYDLVVVNASWGPERFNHPHLLSWLRDLSSKGAALCGLDTGAFVLATTGLMKDRRAAVHYEHIAAFRELFPKVIMGEELYVIDEEFLTCCGGLASTDLALEIIRLQQGIELANAASRYIFHTRLRDGSEGQFPNRREPVGYSAPSKLREAIILMERNLETTLAIGEIAKRVAISQRQLDRIFRRHTGVSPVRYYLEARLDRARGLVTQTELPILDVAVACGFSGHAQFTRAYKNRFDVTPSRDRVVGRVPFQFRSFPSHAGI